MNKKVVVGGVLALVAGGLIGGLLYINNSVGNVVVGDIDVSYMSIEDANEKILSTLGSYKFSISDYVIDGDDIKLGCDVYNDLVYKAQGRSILDKFKRLDLKLNIEYDRDLLEDTINNSGLLNGDIESVSAYVDEHGNIVGEQIGNIVNTDKLYSEIDEHIKELGGDLDIRDYYSEPLVTSKELEEFINNKLGYEIVFNTYKGEYKLDVDYMKKYIEADSNGDLSLSEDLASDYVSKLNRELTSMGLPVEFKTTSGDVITVPGGNWGWWLNTSETKENLQKCIEAGVDGSCELIWRQQSYDYKETGNYVEIDMGKQHLYLYSGGSLLGDWDIVTGTYSSSDRRTPEGIYKLTYKERNATLNGVGYSTPVKYWMPFNGGIGMHDASWRSSFGGNIYKSNGSHGCINMPTEGAKKVFDTIDETYAIICYY